MLLIVLMLLNIKISNRKRRIQRQQRTLDELNGWIEHLMYTHLTLENQKQQSNLVFGKTHSTLLHSENWEMKFKLSFEFSSFNSFVDANEPWPEWDFSHSSIILFLNHLKSGSVKKFPTQVLSGGSSEDDKFVHSVASHLIFSRYVNKSCTSSGFLKTFNALPTSSHFKCMCESLVSEICDPFGFAADPFSLIFQINKFSLDLNCYGKVHRWSSRVYFVVSRLFHVSKLFQWNVFVWW